VDAERAGEDVDAAPEYAALLRHLDHCADCTTLYAEVSEDLEALVGEADKLPRVRPAAPTFFAPARESDNVILRVLRGMARRFELTLAAPRLAPAIATLSGGGKANVFSDRLSEVQGHPFVGVTLRPDNDRAELAVAIREASAATRWRVRLMTGDIVREATTDAQGIARFTDLPVAGLREINLHCAELVAET
jgi:hypothetical protein